MNQKEAEREESNRDENQPRYTRDEYEDWKPNADTPAYEAAIREALRQVQQEDAFYKRELPIGIRAGIQPDYDGDVPGMVEHAVMKIGGEVIEKDDEEMTEEELVNRLEALLADA